MAADVFSEIRAELLQAKEDSGRSYTELADQIAVAGGPILEAGQIRYLFMRQVSAPAPTSGLLGAVTRELGLNWTDVRRRAYGLD